MSLLTNPDQRIASTSSRIGLKPRPLLVEEFVGREEILNAMRNTHFRNSSLQRTPIITVLTGLGGSGKTQIALRFASEFEIKWVSLLMHIDFVNENGQAFWCSNILS